MSEAEDVNPWRAEPDRSRLIFKVIDGIDQDPVGSFFDPIPDTELEAQLFDMRDLFTFREPTEFELLVKLFDCIEFMPTEDEISSLRTYGYTKEADDYASYRKSFHELIRLGIDEFKREYMPDGSRDIDALTELYENSQAADNSTPVRALTILRSQHHSPVINNAEASLRTLYDARR